jgi:hypothetical protein
MPRRAHWRRLRSALRPFSDSGRLSCAAPPNLYELSHSGELSMFVGHARSRKNRFKSDDFVSCTGLLFPRIEGLMRTHRTSLGVLQDRLALASVSLERTVSMWDGCRMSDSPIGKHGRSRTSRALQKNESEQSSEPLVGASSQPRQRLAPLPFVSLVGSKPSAIKNRSIVWVANQ